MSITIIPAIVLACLRFFQPQNDQTVKGRLLRIKLEYAKTFGSAWKGAGPYDKNIPIIYYQGSVMYIVNPSGRFLNAYEPKLVYAGPDMKLYKTNVPADELRFHMEVSVSTGADQGSFYHDFPYVKCSSYEEAKNVIPALTYDAWIAMIVHECFHVVQYRHPSYLANAGKNGSMDPALGDSLQNLYKRNAWFKKMADQENALILNAIAAKGKKRTDSLIHEFFVLRDQRRTQARQTLHLDVGQIEQNYETLEGTARYLEAASLKLSALARFFRSKTVHSFHKPYLEPQWLYDSGISDRYFYATGYNLTRLLDRLGVPYKQTLFDRVDLTLEKILKEAFREECMVMQH